MTIMVSQGKIAFAMTESFQKKCAEIKKKFIPLSTEERYQLLMDMGRRLPPYPDSLKTPDNKVAGCQSTLYLRADSTNGKIFFQAHSDALISSGLAALLICAYSDEPPETLLQHPPTFLTDLNLPSTLTPTRTTGLAHIHLRMKQLALLAVVKKK